MGAKRTNKLEPGYFIAKSFLLPWLGNFFRWHFEGVERIPDKGPAIIAVNHVSFFDPLAVAYAIHRNGRRPRFLAKDSLFRIPVVGWILRTARQIPVFRGSGRASTSLVAAIDALKRGEVVVIFPEGTISLEEDLTPLPPKTGVARLALETGLPVIPCGTWGGQWIWGYHVGFKPGFRKEVWVRFGKPMTFAEFEGMPAEPSTWDRISASVMDEIGVQLAGLQAARPWRAHPLARFGRKKLAEKQRAADVRAESEPRPQKKAAGGR